MHVAYFFRHSPHGDEELRFSLRSVRRFMPYVEKAWIFGDRPLWLRDDSPFVEVLAHEELAWIGGFRAPVVNDFLMHYLLALAPELPEEFLHFCDDYVVLDECPWEEARKVRYLHDLGEIRLWGHGLWKEQLRRTYDTLRRLGLPGLNFESHMPVWMTKRRILRAYRDLRDFVTEDRFFGLTAKTAILNHALGKGESLSPVRRDAEGFFAGFHRRQFATAEIASGCAGKHVLNFDDWAFNGAMQIFLEQRLPDPIPGEATRPPPRPASLETSSDNANRGENP